MSLGLLTTASSGRRRVIGTGSTGGSAGSSRASVRSKTVHFRRPALYRILESSFLHFGTGPGSGGSKRLTFKGRACTESSFLDFGTGPGFGEAQNGSFIKAALVKNRHS